MFSHSRLVRIYFVKLLIFYLTDHWDFTRDNAYVLYGAYTSLVYMMPVIGGMLADRFLGSRKSVTYGAILLVLGVVIAVVAVVAGIVVVVT